jgi:hypothetical protein
MSIPDKAEEQAYIALAAVMSATRNRPNERIRIMKAVITEAARLIDVKVVFNIED